MLKDHFAHPIVLKLGDESGDDENFLLVKCDF